MSSWVVWVHHHCWPICQNIGVGGYDMSWMPQREIESYSTTLSLYCTYSDVSAWILPHLMHAAGQSVWKKEFQKFELIQRNKCTQWAQQ